MSARDSLALVGRTIGGHFLVEGVIGEGAHSLVYRAKHLGPDEWVAIRVVKACVSSDPSAVDQFVRKWRAESAGVAGVVLGDPQLVRTIEFGTAATGTGSFAPFAVSEWVDGQSFAEMLAGRNEPYTLAEAIQLLGPPAQALAYAHRSGVAHGCLTPRCLMLALSEDSPKQPQLRVLDVGLRTTLVDITGDSGFYSSRWATPEHLDRSLGDPGLTTDVYSFALILSEALNGRIRSPSVAPPGSVDGDPTEPPAASHIERTIARALLREPSARWPDLGIFWSAVQSAMADDQAGVPLASWQAEDTGNVRRGRNQSSAPTTVSSSGARRISLPSSLLSLSEDLTPTGLTPTGMTPTGRTPTGLTPTGMTPTGPTDMVSALGGAGRGSTAPPPPHIAFGSTATATITARTLPLIPDVRIDPPSEPLFDSPTKQVRALLAEHETPRSPARTEAVPDRNGHASGPPRVASASSATVVRPNIVRAPDEEDLTPIRQTPPPSPAPSSPSIEVVVDVAEPESPAPAPGRLEAAFEAEADPDEIHFSIDAEKPVPRRRSAKPGDPPPEAVGSGHATGLKVTVPAAAAKVRVEDLPSVIVEPVSQAPAPSPVLANLPEPMPFALSRDEKTVVKREASDAAAVLRAAMAGGASPSDPRMKAAKKAVPGPSGVVVSPGAHGAAMPPPAPARHYGASERRARRERRKLLLVALVVVFVLTVGALIATSLRGH